MAPEKADHLVGVSRSSPIDAYVGSHIRIRRTLLGLSQDRLGHSIGVTVQQIQKYEQGALRLGASRLFEISRVLDVPLSYFFDDILEVMSKALVSGARGRTSGSAEGKTPLNNLTEGKLATREELQLVRIYYRISNQAVRQRLFDLIKSLGSLPRSNEAPKTPT